MTGKLDALLVAVDGVAAAGNPESIAESEFVDGLNVSELEAFDRLDEVLRMGKAESKGKL